jgi:hypothetical protein
VKAIWRRLAREIVTYRPIHPLERVPLMTLCTLTYQLEQSQSGGTVLAKLYNRWRPLALYFGLVAPAARSPRRTAPSARRAQGPRRHAEDAARERFNAKIRETIEELNNSEGALRLAIKDGWIPSSAGLQPLADKVRAALGIAGGQQSNAESVRAKLDDAMKPEEPTP